MSTKPEQVIGAYAALLELTARNLARLTTAINARDPRTPERVEQARGAIDLVEAGLVDARASLDTIDGG